VNSNFDALDTSYRLIRELRAPLAKLQRKDRRLWSQLRNAASSISLNIAEGRGRSGQDRRQFWRIAAGSAEEVRAALKVGEAFGDLGPSDLEPALESLDRLFGMLWRMTH
jgi:four helix bundle protein